MLRNHIALGTVQFGLPYGIANQFGQISRDETATIMECAWSAGINTLDTAISYGESEQRLGEIGVERWEIITKLPVIPESCSDVSNEVQELVKGSLERLRVTKLRGLLLHRSQQLLEPQGEEIYRTLMALRDQGVVEKIGVSIYAPDELDVLWPNFQFDLVQAPFNIIDRRLATTGWLARLHQAGTEVHIRSVFLQGLLLMAPTNRPKQFNRWQQLWAEWQNWLDAHTISPVQACLGFAMSQPEINRVIVGVDSLNQFQEVLDSVDLPHAMPPEILMSEDLNLINPSNWK